METLSKEETDVIRLLHDEKYFIESLISIRTEDSGLRPFIFNPIQSKYWKKATRRDLILKSRRIGFSTLILAKFLVKAITNEGFISQIVTHQPASANKLFDDLKVMFNSIDKEFRPKVGYDNKSELTFPELSSRITISAAGKDLQSAEGLGKSGQINALHCSEFAMWPLPKQSMTAILPCVPLSGEIVIETTARGFNDFHTRWKKAKTGNDVFTAHFFPWQDDPKCYLPLLPGDAQRMLSKTSPDRLTEGENVLLKKFRLSLEQLKWRRYKILEIGSEDFPQEYPSDDNECFLQSGRPFFNTAIVQGLLETSVQKPMIYWPGTSSKLPIGWRMFKPPVPGRKYVGGVDCAEGLPDGDYDSVTILDKETGEEVCHIYGNFGPSLLARHIAHATKVYGEILWGVEKNNHGHALIITLLEREKLPTRFLYHHVAYDDSRRGRAVYRPGWITDPKSRPIMLDELHDAIEQSFIKLLDADQVSEFLTFVVNDSGKPEAQSGANDDTVISAAIAWQMRKTKPFKMVGWN